MLLYNSMSNFASENALAPTNKSGVTVTSKKGSFGACVASRARKNDVFFAAKTNFQQKSKYACNYYNFGYNNKQG